VDFTVLRRKGGDGREGPAGAKGILEPDRGHITVVANAVSIRINAFQIEGRGNIPFARPFGLYI